MENRDGHCTVHQHYLHDLPAQRNKEMGCHECERAESIAAPQPHQKKQSASPGCVLLHLFVQATLTAPTNMKTRTPTYPVPPPRRWRGGTLKQLLVLLKYRPLSVMYRPVQCHQQTQPSDTLKHQHLQISLQCPSTAFHPTHWRRRR